MQVIEKAYAKVNISLNLTGQKDHNLHYLVSMICFCDFYDTISIEDSREFKYVINDDVSLDGALDSEHQDSISDNEDINLIDDDNNIVLDVEIDEDEK